MDPDLPGAQLDLAQALALEGDKASASALLRHVAGRNDLAGSLRTAIDLQLASLDGRLAGALRPSEGGWFSRAHVTSLAGIDSNLNNAPAVSQVTLTLPAGDIVLPLDPTSRPDRGGAWMNTASWQGVRARGRSLLVVQGDLRARTTADGDTGFGQADLSAAWLQAPDARAQWIVRAGASHLRFGGQTLLHSRRASLQRQEATLAGTPGCRPTVGGELEHRRFPEGLVLNGTYAGLTAGLICRPDADTRGLIGDVSYMNFDVRVGQDHPSDTQRVGGTYRRSEIRLQGGKPLLGKGLISMQWSSVHQTDSEAYSPLLGNVPRRTLRHGIQVETQWPVGGGLFLVGTMDASWQRSNIPAFISRQRSIYLGLRWDLM